MVKIQIIVGSSREGRGTPQVAAWVEKTARATQTDVEWSVVDLKDFALPFMSDGYPPQNNPSRELTGVVKDWVETVAQADGYVIVTPEYNHSIPAVLKNALDTLDFQLQQKPVAIVSHGAIGGARANEHLRLIVNSNLGAVPIPESVTLNAMPAFAEVFTADGDLVEAHVAAQKPLEGVLESIVWYTNALAAAK